MPGLDSEYFAAASDFAARLRQHLGGRLKEVRVFGSQAEETAQPGSAMDCFVLVDHHDSRLRREISGIADDVMTATEFKVVPFPMVMDETELEWRREREQKQVLEILQDGIEVPC